MSDMDTLLWKWWWACMCCFFCINWASVSVCCFSVLWPLATVLYGLLTIERAWSRDHATVDATVRWPPFCHRRTNAVEQSAWRASATRPHLWTIQAIVENVYAVAPCVWTLRHWLEILLTYLLTLCTIFNNTYINITEGFLKEKCFFCGRMMWLQRQCCRVKFQIYGTKRPATDLKKSQCVIMYFISLSVGAACSLFIYVC